jgi:hypothetical protein
MQFHRNKTRIGFYGGIKKEKYFNVRKQLGQTSQIHSVYGDFELFQKLLFFKG